MTIFDVAIIGGGIVGSSAALHLRDHGFSVALIERGQCGSQASGVNFGGVRQQGRAFAELPVAIRSRELWGRLPDLIGTDGEFVRSGHLKLARTAEQMDDLRDYAVQASGYGLPLEILSSRQLRGRYSWLGDGIAGGSFCSNDGHANPRLVSPAFARAARAAGAEIVEGCEVVVVAKSADEFVLHLAGGETYRSRALINSAGAWGAGIAAQFGESIPEDVIAPNMAVTEPLPHFIGPNLGVCGGNIYVRQIDRGNVIFGGGLGIADRDALRARPLAASTAEATHELLALVPKLADIHVIRTWSGIEGVTPDRLPVIGPSGTVPGLFHAFGFSGHGFQLGPAVGAILSDLVATGKSATPIGAFAPTRFGTGLVMQADSGATASPGTRAASEVRHNTVEALPNSAH